MRWSFSVLRRHEPFLQKAKKNKPDYKGTRRRARWSPLWCIIKLYEKGWKNPSWTRGSNSPKKLGIFQSPPWLASSALTSRTANKARWSLLHSQAVLQFDIALDYGTNKENLRTNDDEWLYQTNTPHTVPGMALTVPYRYWNHHVNQCSGSGNIYISTVLMRPMVESNIKLYY